MLSEFQNSKGTIAELLTLDTKAPLFCS